MRVPILHSRNMVEVNILPATGRDSRGLVLQPKPAYLGRALVEPLVSPETTGDVSDANATRIQAVFPRQQLTVASTDQVEIRTGTYAGVYDVVDAPAIWPRGTVLRLRKGVCP